MEGRYRTACGLRTLVVGQVESFPQPRNRVRISSRGMICSLGSAGRPRLLTVPKGGFPQNHLPSDIVPFVATDRYWQGEKGMDVDIS